MRLRGVTRDITKDRIAEDGLRKRERAFRELLEALPGAVYTTDARGRVTFFNRAAVDIWGSRPRLGYTQWGGAWPLFHLDGTPMPDEDSPLAVALREDRPIRGVEVIGERPDGTRVHFIPYPTPLHDESGALVGAVNMLIDITELKRTEAALRESETRLRQGLTAGRVIAFEWDPRTRLSQRSDNAAEILGCEPTQAVDRVRNTFLARVHPEDRAGFKAHVYGVRPDNPGYSATFRFLHPDGHVVWLEETAEAEFDAAARFVRLKGVTRDVSERKRAEERQNLLVAELDHRVKNVLACVSAVAQRSREGSPSIDRVPQVARWPHSFNGQCPRASEPGPLARRAPCRSRSPRAGALGRGRQRHRGGSRHRAHRRRHAIAGDGAPRARDERRQVRRVIDAERARVACDGTAS